jgi:hypothetical protein
MYSLNICSFMARYLGHWQLLAVTNKAVDGICEQVLVWALTHGSTFPTQHQPTNFPYTAPNLHLSGCSLPSNTKLSQQESKKNPESQ